MNPEFETLVLDATPIDPDTLPLSELVRELEHRDRPAPQLRALVRAFDRKRQAHGLGWSRPWNKTGMTIFRTHRHEPGADVASLRLAMDTIREYAPEPLLTRAFIEELFADPARTALTFYHDRQTRGAGYEGLTISFGRAAADGGEHLDRVDLILEDRCVEGRVDGHVDLVRVIVCPWHNYAIDRDHHRHEQCEFSGEERAWFDGLYRECVRTHDAWREDAAHRWSHWMSMYREHFGPRTSAPAGTAFA